MKKNIFKALIIIAILLYICKVSINTISGKDKTVPLKYGNLLETINTNGYIVRNEIIINSPIVGELKKIVASGTRVPKGKEVAEVISQSFDKEKLNELNDINKRIQDIKNNKEINPYESDIDNLNNQINAEEEKYKEAINSNSPKKNDIKKRIDDLTNKKNQILKSGPESIRNLDELYNQKKILEQNIAQYLYKVYAPDAGIISYYFDDYESSLNQNKLYNISLNDINSVNKEPTENKGSVKQNEPIVKIINNSDWYILVPLNYSESKMVKEGTNIRVTIDGNDQSLRGKILKLYSVNNKTYIAVLDMNDEYKDFYKKRKITVILTINDYEGFMVPKSSLVNKDGKTGVFVISDNNLPIFKEVNVKTQNRENAIIESKDNTNGLRLYDEIVVNGKNYIKK
ncbi:HlyD family efflux transporter periplasmic adaptor subunit [Thermoanaerobacterium sp. RBIITD]|uniref:HlyD family efflux transporter periplasmic adaptor subunit n=1 Tax=Thermoanaerobacterium sp. RBIITD TaxID=1550240 RepID=UPI000BB7CCBB|nr:HlyD family efflux transporter periplasmic adaptor subunit [Thermoanaerobacterium sp. RBIITD]SNX55270.1 putative membrane fusion protein [Thermoanaerobacterium sp. RBIITD]